MIGSVRNPDRGQVKGIIGWIPAYAGMTDQRGNDAMADDRKLGHYFYVC